MKFYHKTKRMYEFFDFLGVEFDPNGAKDIKRESKQNFSIKISRLYECIQAITRCKSIINRTYTNGKKLYKYYNSLELEMIKKFIRSINGWVKYRGLVRVPFK